MDLNKWHLTGTFDGLQDLTGQSGRPYSVMHMTVRTFGKDGEWPNRVELTVFRELAEVARTLSQGDYAHVSGAFSWRESNGRTYMDLKVQDIVRLRTAQQATPQQAAQAFQTPQQGFTVPAPQYQQPAPPAPRYGQPVTDQEMQDLF